jgi:aryl carrier-like protein
VPGEIWIGGAGVARGYLNRPELNAERFTADPFAAQGRVYKTGDRARYLPGGALEYLGRMDNQVKIRGFRIEPGEIEAVLRQHPAVRDAAVTDRLDGPGGTYLVAYVAAWQGAEQSVPSLRRHLSEKLPDYMIPGAFVWLDNLPLTAHGKLDRNALPSPLAQRCIGDKSSEEPRNEVEKTLAEIWTAVLGVKDIGVNDNFFELGGDSILSIQIVARASSSGIRITPSQLFANQTIAALAAVSESASATLAEQGPVTGDVSLSPIQHWFFEQNLAEAHHWNQSVLLELHESLQSETLERAFVALTEHHDMLRS